MYSEPLRAAIDIMITKNIVVFDSQAKPAELTLRLIDLLDKEVTGGLTAIIVCENCVIPSEIVIKYPRLAFFKINENTYRQLHSYYYSTLWGTLAPDDLCMIIGINDRFDFILGSY
jgi:hypothetical protein